MMKNDGAPSWLFSFVDLAFLMLIAMTQLADPSARKPLDLGEVVLPRIGAEATEERSGVAAEMWQLRVLPRAGEQSGEPAEGPFQLVHVSLGGETTAECFSLADALRERLAVLQAEAGSRPVLAPHEDSRSQDLLDAAVLLEELWPGRRRVTVARLFDS